MTFDELKEAKYIKYNIETIMFISEVKKVQKDKITLLDVYSTDTLDVQEEFIIERSNFEWSMKIYENIEVFYSKDDIIEYFI